MCRPARLVPAYATTVVDQGVSPQSGWRWGWSAAVAADSGLVESDYVGTRGVGVGPGGGHGSGILTGLGGERDSGNGMAVVLVLDGDEDVGGGQAGQPSAVRPLPEPPVSVSGH